MLYVYTSQSVPNSCKRSQQAWLNEGRAVPHVDCHVDYRAGRERLHERAGGCGQLGTGQGRIAATAQHQPMVGAAALQRLEPKLGTELVIASKCVLGCGDSEELGVGRWHEQLIGADGHEQIVRRGAAPLGAPAAGAAEGVLGLASARAQAKLNPQP